MTTKIIGQSKTSSLPTEKWQSIGNEFLKLSEASLWAKDGMQALKYLHSLGLKDETLHKYHIGYNPKDGFGSLEAWGLPIAYNANGNPKKVWLPRGIVIPCNIEKVIRSIKIRRYLTKEQKSKGELSDYSIKGSVPGLFGAENLTSATFAVLTDNEFDALLLDQCVGDVAGAASFGRAVKGIGAPEWVLWGRYLLPVPYILVPCTNAEENFITTDSLPVYSRRTHFAYLPNASNVKFVTDLLKVGVDPRDWLMQAMSSLRSSEDTIHDKSASGVCESDTSVEVVALELSSHKADEEFSSDIDPTQNWIIINPNEHWLVDTTIMPASPCYSCKNDEFWQRSDGGWVCNICHPNPNSQSLSQVVSQQRDPKQNVRDAFVDDFDDFDDHGERLRRLQTIPPRVSALPMQAHEILEVIHVNR